MKKMLVMVAVAALAAVSGFSADEADTRATCSAKTLAGTQCKRRAMPGSKFCWQHARMKGVETAEGLAALNDGQCQGTTKSGERCKRKAVEGSKFCPVHAKTAVGEDAKKTVKAGKEKVKADKEKAKVGKEKAKKTVEEAEAAVAPGQCEGTTKAGERCKRKAVPGSKFCAQHAAK